MMTSSATILLTLACALLGAGFVSASRLRLRTLVALFRTEGVLLSVFALVLGLSSGEQALLAVAVVIFILKGILIPAFLLRVARHNQIAERLETFVRPTTLAIIAFAAIIAALIAALQLPFASDVFYVATAFSLVLFGFELLIAHKNLFGQGIGFLTLENGIFFFGLSVAHGMPLFVEIGTLIDLLALFVLAIALIRRVQQMHASIATDYLESLNDL